MESAYFVKTRNFNCNKTVARILPIIARIFGVSGTIEPDLDGKFYLKTQNTVKAWTVLVIFMALRHWSGGWTYIVRPGKCENGGYKSIY